MSKSKKVKKYTKEIKKKTGMRKPQDLKEYVWFKDGFIKSVLRNIPGKEHISNQEAYEYCMEHNLQNDFDVIEHVNKIVFNTDIDTV